MHDDIRSGLAMVESSTHENHDNSRKLQMDSQKTEEESRGYTPSCLQLDCLDASRQSLRSDKTTQSFTTGPIYKSTKTPSMSVTQIRELPTDLFDVQTVPKNDIETVTWGSDGYDEMDRGYAWVVLAASSYLVMVSLIPTASIGVIYVELSELYGRPEIVAWMCNIQAALLSLAGPVAAIISQKFGTRKTCLVGSIGIVASLIATANLTSLPATFAIFGVLLGLLTAVICIPAMTFTARYFAKRRILAMGMTGGGGGAAFILFPNFIKTIEFHFGWRAALYALAGCAAQGVVASMLLREPKFPPRKDLDQSQNVTTSFISSAMLDSEMDIKDDTARSLYLQDNNNEWRAASCADGSNPEREYEWEKLCDRSEY